MRAGNEFAARFFETNLLAAKDFLEARGWDIDNPVLMQYHVGYASAGNAFRSSALGAKYSKSVLIDADLLKENENKQCYDTFRDRVIFPYYDLQGRIVGFTGRIVTPKENVGKYINTGNTALFTKGNNLYGIYQAKQEISRCNSVYIVEGQFDVLSMVNAGVKNVIAGSGCAFTDAQVRLIHRLTDNVVLMYDDDVAGAKASLVNCESLLKAGITVKCIIIPDGMDPDELARKEKDNLPIWLKNRTLDFVTYFYDILLTTPNLSHEETEKRVDKICNLIASLPSEFQKNSYITDLASLTKINAEILINKVRSIRKKLPAEDKPIKAGIYGIEELKESFSASDEVEIFYDYDLFLDQYGTKPVLYITGVPSESNVQLLRQVAQKFIVKNISIEDHSLEGGEPDELLSLKALFQSGYDILIEKEEQPLIFLQYYVRLYSVFLREYLGEKTPYLNQVMEMISYAPDPVRLVNKSDFKTRLEITEKTYDGLLKPYVDRRKSLIKNTKLSNNDDLFDQDELPDYVEDKYHELFHTYGFYPRLNKDGIPVCYMFRNEKGGYTQVADFYLEPLLHIYDKDPEQNRRIFKINRRYYKKPLYVEWISKTLNKLSLIKDNIINLEAVNFTNGEEKHWTKIQEGMSRHYVLCNEISVYGNQQTNGLSRNEDEMFFAFSNAIFHFVNGKARVDRVDELGAVDHNAQNYYLPAFSTIYSGMGKHDEKYENISQLYYYDVPVEKQCSFKKWSWLMDNVYKINDNGKWALLYSIMCAFRSNIHAIDRLFTALFFIGPTNAGKTQIMISIRSLFISPNVPIFNLNMGTDAVMSTQIGTFRDVPIVLDEYNNRQISDFKFQALKSIVYDGDGRQKRKATGTKEVETDKVFAPVIIGGQETPQRDDNALMNRVIICEVKLPSRSRTSEEVDLFTELKEIEDPEKIGLSNVLFEILKLRPVVMDHFREAKKQCYNELKACLSQTGEIDRLMKTCSLFLAMCKLIENYTELELPFSYTEFFKTAIDKIRTQMDMISHTDKLAIFFKAMDVMIDSHNIVEGRDFAIGTPSKLTIKVPGGDKQEISLAPGTHVLYLRISAVYTQFARSSFNTEDSNQSTIEQNLRSHRAYLGAMSSHKFTWEETVEVTHDDPNKIDSAALNQMKAAGINVGIDNTMVRKRIKKSVPTSCIALNYDMFKEFYDIDLTRANPDAEQFLKDTQDDEDVPF